MERNTGVSRGLERVVRRVLQTFARRPDRPDDLRLCVERVTGIEPAWPAWKVSRAPEAAAALASILGIAVSMEAGRLRPAPEALTRAPCTGRATRGWVPDSAGAAASTS